ncbi:DUF3180 family protein [Microbacterium sp. gxy059]|uniref:DUF3180 family protein n=1 Tax=Microbacterium sp. gxy059 TaxID=2957199 RepID=UPI003D998C29
MTRTRATTIALFALAGAAAGFLLDHALTASGRPTFTPATMLPILLVLLGLGCLALAWQVRRAVTSEKGPRVDPFRALRIAVLAKASALVGALVGGAGAGLLLFLLTRPVTPGLGSLAPVIATVLAGLALVVLALIAENLCTLPKDPDERQPDAPEPGAEPEF